jgi:hypothetical protein
MRGDALSSHGVMLLSPWPDDSLSRWDGHDKGSLARVHSLGKVSCLTSLARCECRLGSQSNARRFR